MFTKEQKIQAIITGQANEFKGSGHFVIGSNNSAIRDHISSSSGFDWWIFPSFSKNQANYHVDRTEPEGTEIYKALREDANYSKNYVASINRYIEAFTEGDIKHQISYPIRFLKLIQSLIGITENNTKLIQGLTQEKQDDLFEMVYNFLREKKFYEKKDIDENYFKDLEDLDQIIKKINEGREEGKKIKIAELPEYIKSKKSSPKSNPSLAKTIDFGGNYDKNRFTVADSFYTPKGQQQKDFFRSQGVELKDDEKLFYCLTGTYTVDDAGGGGLMDWFRGFADTNFGSYVAKIKTEKAKITKQEGGSDKLFTDNNGSGATANTNDAKSKIFQFSHLIKSQDKSKGDFIYGISPNFNTEYAGIDPKSVMRKWGYHFRRNIEKLLKDESDPAKVKIVIPVFSGKNYAGPHQDKKEELRQGMLEGLFLYERETSLCKKFTFLLSGFNEDEIKQARENVYSQDGNSPLKMESITSITSQEAESWGSIKKIETKQAKKEKPDSSKKPKDSSIKKEPENVKKDEMLNYALKAYFLNYKGSNSQEYFNTQFSLDDDKPQLSKEDAFETRKQKYTEYLNKKLTQADSENDRKTQYLQSFQSKTKQSNDRQIHSGLHAFLTAQYAEACLNLYRKYKSHFPKEFQGQIEEFDDSNKLEELKFLVAMHDVARTHHGSDHDEHKNAFYVALILEQEFNKTREEAIELAFYVACKGDNKHKKNKTLFSKLIQSADSIAYSRVGGGANFDKKRCNICNDFSYFFTKKEKKPQIFASFEKSFAEFTKKTESLEKDLVEKGKYAEEIEVGAEPKKGYESFFTKSDQNIKEQYEEIVKMSSDFLKQETKTFTFRESSSLQDNDKQKSEFFGLMYLDERMHIDKVGVTTQHFKNLSEEKSTEQEDSAEIVERVLNAFALNKNKYVTEYSPHNENSKDQYEKKEAKEEDALLIKIDSNYIAKINEVFDEKGIDETLEDENNVEFKKLGSTVQEKIKTTQNSKYKITGNEFCVQLKRFHVSKDFSPIKIETSFTNRKLSIEKEGEAEKKDYLPTAFIVHKGTTTKSGHYICYVKCKDNKWYCINDSSASVVKSENMTDGFPHELNNAYIVKYSNQQAELPDQNLFQHGYTNHGNDCYANASLNFLKSLTSTLPRELVFETTKKEESKSKVVDHSEKSTDSYGAGPSSSSSHGPSSSSRGAGKVVDGKDHDDGQPEDQKMMAILKKRPLTIKEMLEEHNKKFERFLHRESKLKFVLQYDRSNQKFTLISSDGLTSSSTPISEKEVDDFEESINKKGDKYQEIMNKYKDFYELRKNQGKSKEEADQATKLPGEYIKILQVINLVNQEKTKSS